MHKLQPFAKRSTALQDRINLLQLSPVKQESHTSATNADENCLRFKTAMKENRYVPVSTSHQKRMAALHQIRLKKKEPENSPSMVQSTAEAVDDDSDEALAIRKPNGSLASRGLPSKPKPTFRTLSCQSNCTCHQDRKSLITRITPQSLSALSPRFILQESQSHLSDLSSAFPSSLQFESKRAAKSVQRTCSRELTVWETQWHN